MTLDELLTQHGEALNEACEAAEALAGWWQVLWELPPYRTPQEEIDAWRTWHRENASAWDKVECIECELGRTCHVHRQLCPICQGEGHIPKEATP